MRYKDTIGKTAIAILWVTLLCTGISHAQVQDSTTQKKKEILLGVGPAAYKGDLSNSYDKWSSVAYIGLKFNRFKKINGNFTLSIGSVTGQNINYGFDDGSAVSPTPNNFFRTTLVALNYELHYNIINKDKFKLYISQGVGVVRFDPQDEFNTSLVDQPSTRALGETYASISLFFPTQIGILYYLPNDYSVGMQAGYWGTTTDYLDNISQWSNSKGSDNVLSVRFEIHIPIEF